MPEDCVHANSAPDDVGLTLDDLGNVLERAPTICGQAISEIPDARWIPFMRRPLPKLWPPLPLRLNDG